jgi:hypothetical protein
VNALAPYMAALHQQDLLDQAELKQLARLARSSNPNVPAWRRNLGGGARRVSSAFASAARSLDPSVEQGQRAAKRTSERPVGRMLSC